MTTCPSFPKTHCYSIVPCSSEYICTALLPTLTLTVLSEKLSCHRSGTSLRRPPSLRKGSPTSCPVRLSFFRNFIPRFLYSKAPSISVDRKVRLYLDQLEAETHHRHGGISINSIIISSDSVIIRHGTPWTPSELRTILYRYPSIHRSASSTRLSRTDII